MADIGKTRSVAAGVAVVFGLLTVVSGGRALFGGADMGAVVGGMGCMQLMRLCHPAANRAGPWPRYAPPAHTARP